MFFEYLTRGVSAGLLAGVVFAVFVAAVANPVVGFADQQHHAVGESGHDHQAAHGHETGGEQTGETGPRGAEGGSHATPVSAAVTEIVSVLASGLWAVLLGGVVFGVAFYFLEPAIPGTGATKRYVLAAAGFLTVSGAPWLVLPPAAPGAEQSLAVGTRLPLYAGMMVAGALSSLLAGWLYTRLRDATGRAVAGSVALLSLGVLALPASLAPANAVQGTLAPGLANGVTGLIVFGQALLWLLLATAHAQLSGRGAESPRGAGSTNTAVASPAD
jgi:hypothetical protein